MGIAHAGPALHAVRPHRHAGARRLQPEHAAARRGNPERAAAVGGVGDRQDPRRHQRRRAARGPAGRMGEAPRIARRPVQHRLGGEAEAEFRRIGLAEYRQPRLEVAFDQRAGMVGPKPLEGARTEMRLGAGQQRDVLQRERHAAKRPVGQAAGDLPAREVLVADRNRVDRRNRPRAGVRARRPAVRSAWSRPGERVRRGRPRRSPRNS